MHVLHIRPPLVDGGPSRRGLDRYNRRSFAKKCIRCRISDAEHDSSYTTEYNWQSLSEGTLEEALVVWQEKTSPNVVVEVVRDQDVREASKIIAKGFYKAPVFGFFDAFFLHLFEDEVLDIVLSARCERAKDEFAVLVAREEHDAPIIGVVQVSHQTDGDVIQNLPSEVQSYAYISSMAVLPEKRRKGIGSTLLSAAEFVAWIWAKGEIVLNVYENNTAARELYRYCGYEEISMRSNNIFGMLSNEPDILLMRRRW